MTNFFSANTHMIFTNLRGGGGGGGGGKKRRAWAGSKWGGIVFIKCKAEKQI